MSSNHVKKKYLGLRECAEVLGITRQGVLYRLQSGQLHGVKNSKGHWEISIDAPEDAHGDDTKELMAEHKPDDPAPRVIPEPPPPHTMPAETQPSRQPKEPECGTAIHHTGNQRFVSWWLVSISVILVVVLVQVIRLSDNHGKEKDTANQSIVDANQDIIQQLDGSLVRATRFLVNQKHQGQWCHDPAITALCFMTLQKKDLLDQELDPGPVRQYLASQKAEVKGQWQGVLMDLAGSKMDGRDFTLCEREDVPEALKRSLEERLARKDLLLGQTTSTTVARVDGGILITEKKETCLCDPAASSTAFCALRSLSLLPEDLVPCEDPRLRKLMEMHRSYSVFRLLEGHGFEAPPILSPGWQVQAARHVLRRQNADGSWRSAGKASLDDQVVMTACTMNLLRILDSRRM